MLVFVLVILVILLIVSIRKYGTITNPFVLEIQSTALMILIPQILWLMVDPKAKLYIYSDLAILTYVIFAFVGTSINIKSVKLSAIENVSAVNAVNWILFGIFVAPILPLFLSFEFSIDGFRAFYEFVVFSKYASFFELSKFVLYLIIFYRLISQRKVTFGTLILIPLLFLYGSKMALLDFFFAFLVFLEHFRGVSYRKVAYMSAACAMLLIFVRYYQSSDDDSDMWITALNYFDQYKNQTFLIEKLVEGEVDYYHGEIYWSSYLKYIPRFLWEEKPRAFGFAIINYELLPKEAAAGYMPAFGLGPLFADFGFYSVALAALVGGMIRRYLYNVFVKSNNNISFLLYAFPLTILSTLFIMINLVVNSMMRSPVIDKKNEVVEQTNRN